MEENNLKLTPGSEPTCRVNVTEDNTAVEGDDVNLTCEVTYNGRDLASVVWDGIQGNIPVVQSRISRKISYSVAARAPFVPAYNCVISFYVTNIYSEFAINIPVINCATPKLTVLYSARNVTLNPSLTIYSPGSVIRCSADGNPSPTYKWQQLSDKVCTNDISTWMDILDGPEFVPCNITPTQYRCVASNIVKGVHFSDHSRTIWVSSSGEAIPFVSNGYHPTYSVGIAIGMISGMIISVFLTAIVLISLHRLGYINLRRNPTNEALGGNPATEEINKSKRQQAVSPSSTATGDRRRIGQTSTTTETHCESDYAGLGDDRDIHSYASLSEVQKTKKPRTKKRLSESKS